MRCTNQIIIILTFLFLAYLIFALILFTGCKKFVSIPDPASSITSSQVFSTDAQAVSAMSGIYYNMANSNIPALFSGGISVYAGLSADELVLFDQSNNVALQFYKNGLTADNVIVTTNLWAAGFATLYQINAVLEGLQLSETISDSIRKELTGQACFVRALTNFYLTGLFDGLPYITSINWRISSTQPRSEQNTIYKHIIADLRIAQLNLPDDYRAGDGQRIIPNKWAATALLARAYLFTGDWGSAETEASKLIGSSLFSLAPDLDDVFKVNSPEAIFQLQHDPTSYSFNATKEGSTFIPFTGVIPFPPFAYISSSLLNAFEPGDNRRLAWLNSREISGVQYYYPFKYKTGPSEAVPNGPVSEYYTVLRLAEQYLLRSEARIKKHDTYGALADLNVIRNRAGLPNLSASLSEEKIIKAIEQERRIELFAEWGHRWFDLKRWGFASTVLAANKGFAIPDYSLLFPIPSNDLLVNPNLTQNKGY